MKAGIWMDYSPWIWRIRYLEGKRNFPPWRCRMDWLSDIEGVTPYCVVRAKWLCKAYGKPWLLWSCNLAVTSSFSIANRTASNTSFFLCLHLGLLKHSLICSFVKPNFSPNSQQLYSSRCICSITRSEHTVLQSVI